MWVSHGGATPLAHFTDRDKSRDQNVFLTKAIIAACADFSITNEILFNSLLCRYLQTLLQNKGFTPEALITLARNKNVVYPWSFEYDALRGMLNERFQLFPLIIAYPENERDIQYFIRLAQEHQLSLSIRSGGHAAEGYSGSGECVIDVSLLAKIAISKSRNEVVLEAGVPLGLFYTALTDKGVLAPRIPSLALVSKIKCLGATLFFPLFILLQLARQ